MTTSNEHNNAPAVPQGEPEAYMVYGNYTRQPFRSIESAQAYMGGLLKSDPEGGYHIRPLFYATPAAPSQEPAVPQGWTKAADQVPLEADGEVFIRFTDGSIGTGWATYWHGASNDFARWTFPDPDEFRLVSEWAKNVPASTGMHWTENEPVRLPHSRAGRVYLAGPMTGISELNFPAFNQEAERLRAEGLQVLNPADHGIVDGADWADYLRHDIAGLASCERIHLLRGWTKSKGACLEMTIAKALGMTVTYQVDAEMEHNNAPAQGEPFGYFRAEPFGWTDCAATDEGAIALYEHPAKPAQEVGLTGYIPLLEEVASSLEDYKNDAPWGSWDRERLERLYAIIAALRAKGGKHA